MIQNAETPAVVAARVRGTKLSTSPNTDTAPLKPQTTPVQRTNQTAEAQFIQAVRERIDTLGWSLGELDARAGLPDRYAAKILRPHASGRTAKWQTWSYVLGALFPHGYTISITELPSTDRERGRP
jgi:hypothetical protein